MRITFLGTGAGLPSRTRNVSSMALRLPQRREVWLFDCGEGTQHQLLRSDLRISQITRIFITHLHGDHIFGLPGLLGSCSLSGDPGRIDIYGPPGLERFLSVALEISQSTLGFPMQVHTVEPGEILSDGNCTVTALPLEHRIPAYGYRMRERDHPGAFDAEAAGRMGVPAGPLYGRLKQGESVTLPDGRTVDGAALCGPPEPGRVLAYCTDTTYCAGAVELARDADLLVHEATFSARHQELAVISGHSTSEMAARVATEAGAHSLFLTHLSSRYAPGTAIEPEELLREARSIFPATDLAADFLEYEVPRRRG